MPKSSFANKSLADNTLLLKLTAELPCQPNIRDSSNRVKRRGDHHLTSLAFRKIFAQLNLHAAEVEGDSFHRYTRPENGYGDPQSA